MANVFGLDMLHHLATPMTFLKEVSRVLIPRGRLILVEPWTTPFSYFIFRFLTGLASSNAALLVAADGTAVLATDSRYTLAAQRDCPDVELITERFIEPRLAAEMTTRGRRTVAFEAHEMSVERHQELAAAPESVILVPFGRKIEELRTVKDPSELELLATACRITCQAIADVFSLIRPGLTERALAAALDARMADLGAERPAFDTIVASGPNGAIPHHSPTDRPLRRGDLVTMDFGASYGGYHARHDPHRRAGRARRLAARDLPSRKSRPRRPFARSSVKRKGFIRYPCAVVKG